ncbi:unnamed protein product [Oreochromis niloticus]|nr:unnamed protein product [Mustela putorius furo]
MRLLLLLLLVQAFHLASLQYTTDSPGRTIDKSWLRARGKIPEGSENATFTKGKDEGVNVTESNNDYSGTSSGSMGTYSGEEEISGNEKWEDQNVTTTTLSPGVQNGTMEPTELPPTTTADPTNSSQINMTETEGEFNKTVSPRNSTSFPDYSNRTDLDSKTSVPETNTTEEHTTTLTTTLVPGINATTTTSSPTTVFLPDVPETTTAAAPNTPEKVNKTDKSASLAGSSDTDEGFATDPQISKRRDAWGAVLGTAVVVAFVGLVAFVILKKKQQKAFSHRKLVEEYPSEPVLRLDNSEPMDLKFGAYYNPGVQGDTIQMTNLPGRR